MTDTPIGDSIPTGSILPTPDWQPAQSIEDPNSELWPNQEPVVDGIDEVSQDPDFIQNDEVKS